MSAKNKKDKLYSKICLTQVPATKNNKFCGLMPYFVFDHTGQTQNPFPCEVPTFTSKDPSKDPSKDTSESGGHDVGCSKEKPCQLL